MHVDMLVGVNMRGMLTQQILKGFELTRNFELDRRRIVQWNNGVKGDPLFRAVNPFPQVKMKPDVEFRVFSGITGRFTGGRPSRHEAGAGYDPMLVRFYNTPVYSRALAEVIGIDNKILFTAHGLRSFKIYQPESITEHNTSSSLELAQTSLGRRERSPPSPTLPHAILRDG